MTRTAGRSRAGFTLIELLVVIVILGILMVVAVPTFLRQQSKAQDSRTQQYLTTAFKAIRAGTPDTGNQYPSSTSMVSWVQQSEPELTAQRGSCSGGGVTSAPTDAVLVDPASTGNALTLCARSQSGNVWKLTATAAGVQQLLDGTLIPLTFTGNEITDTTRAANTQGDGLPNDSSTGIWEATTNLVKNGGIESNTNFWGTSGNATVGRTTSASKFGTASGTLTCSSAACGYLTTSSSGHPTVSPSTTYTYSAWVKRDSGGAAATVKLMFDEYNGTTFIQGDSGTSVAWTDSWQRLTLTVTTTATTNLLKLFIMPSSWTTGDVLDFDGVQLEQKPSPTPYVETNGTTAARASGRVQAPASLLNATQGWIAARIRPEWAATSPPFAYPTVFDWSNSGSVQLGISYNQSGASSYPNMWTISRYSGSGGVPPSAASTTQSFAAGSSHTIVASWTASQISISVDGAPFVTAANTSIPSTPSLFDSAPTIPTAGIRWTANTSGSPAAAAR